MIDSKRSGIVAAHVVVQLRLALSEVEVGELVHEAQRVVKRPPGLAACLRNRPQPRNVDVGVPCSGDVDVGGRPTRRHRLPSDTQRSWHAGVEVLSEGLSRVEHEDCLVEGGEQPSANWVDVAKLVDHAEGDTSQSVEVPGWLIDLDDRAGAHHEWCHLFDCDGRPGRGSARPTVQGELMAVSVTPPVGEKNLVVVTVAAGVRLTVDVDERLGVAEVAGDAQWQMEGDWAIRAPAGRHGEAAAEYEIKSRHGPTAHPTES